VTLTESAEAILIAAGLASAVEVERSTSKAAITRAARARVPGRGLKKVVEPVLESLRKHGAIARGPGWAKVEALPEERSQ
jgi:hypothetical protein